MPTTLIRRIKRCCLTLETLQLNICRLLRWLLLFMCCCVSAIVVARLFNVGSTAVQESVSYAHAFLFMLTLAYTAQQDGHVRVDIFYRRMNNSQQAWINLLGACLFLLPFALFLVFISWHSAVQSWQIREASSNPGGLALVFLLKSLPPAAGFLLALHALSSIIQNLLQVSLNNETSR